MDGERIVTWTAPAGTFEELRLFYEDGRQRGGPGGWHVTDSTGQIGADAQGDNLFGRSEKSFAGFGQRGTLTIEAASATEQVRVRVRIEQQ